MGSGGQASGNLIRFGDELELDLRAYQLRRSGQSLKLERIPMELLRLLLEHSGQLVTREQIVERIWGKEVFVDTDNSINAAIRKVRQVLDDNPEQPRFVQTVTGRGYRFIAPVQTSTVPPLRVAAEEAAPLFGEPAPGDFALARHRSGPRIWQVILGVVIIVAVAGGAYWQWFRPRLRSRAAPGRVMVAVLPFENLTGDAAQDYLSDGMTEEMISQLGRLDPQHMGVIGRTSVMHYKHSPATLDQVGRELGIEYVLEGSIRRDSDQVRITAQLIQVKDQTHLWARQYDRELSHLLALQGEIAHEISDEIQTALGIDKAVIPPALQSLSPQNYEAYDLYLKGQYFFNKRTAEGFERAIDYYQQAVAKDPNYARAYAGLADCYALIGGYSMAPQTEFMPKARAAALRAVELDDNLPEAHTAWALIVQNYDWDWQTAEKEFRRAIELNPNYATTHHWYAEHLALLGYFDEALREIERARQLDPLSLIIAADKGVILYYSRQYDSAIEQFRAVQDMDPNFPRAGMIRQVYAQKGMFAEVLAEHDKRRGDVGSAFWILSEQAYIDGRIGQRAKANKEIAKMKEWNQRHPVDPEMFVAAYIGMGNKDQAFAWLEKAYTQHSNVVIKLKVDPLYDALRSDPRFQNLLRRVGLAP